MSDLTDLKDELTLLADNFHEKRITPGQFEVGVRGVAADLASRTEPLPELALPVASDAHAVLETVYANLLTTILDEDDCDSESFARLTLDLRERIEEALGEDAIRRINLEVVDGRAFAEVD